MLVAEDANGNRLWAEPNQRAQCPICDGEVQSKCGRVRTWHWAHRSYGQPCDPWTDTESEWHREWKLRFPKSWVEIVQDDGRKRRLADIQHPVSEDIIKFQHSKLDLDEIREREKFFGATKLIWMIDGVGAAKHITFSPEAGSKRRGIIQWKYAKRWAFEAKGWLYLDVGRGVLLLKDVLSLYPFTANATQFRKKDFIRWFKEESPRKSNEPFDRLWRFRS